MTLALPSRRLAPAWVRDDLWRRARAVPSLDLRFADSKSLVDAVTGQSLITFTRASSGTYIGSDGLLKTAATNEPRFDHNPTTGESLGLLVEEQRTNLNTNSEAFGTYGVAAGLVSANQGVAPDGTFSADEITSTGGGIYNSVSGVTASTTYTVSVYAKYVSGGSGFSFGCDANPSAARVVFNLQAGTTSSIGANVVSHSMTLVGNGWYRCAVTFVATSTSLIFVLYNAISGSKWLCWGAQLEAGAFPTSYIPTTGSAATRNADVADIINTAIANGIRTLYAEFRSPASGTRGVVSLNDNTANERAAINTSGTDPRLVVVDSGATQADIDAGTIAANARSRMAVRINTNDFSASFNGGAVVTDTSGTLPTVDRLFIGRSQAGEYLNAPIARLIGWREALPDSVLQELTR